MPTLTELTHRFAIADALVFASGNGGLTRVDIHNRHGDAEVYLQGAHVTHFQPHGGQPLLWLSAQSLFAEGKAIRGGIPVCWPWFGPHSDDASKPSHGFARTTVWSVVETATLADGRTRLVLTLNDSEATMRWWPHAFRMRLTITVGQTLELDLQIDNPGSAPFTFAEALHTYLTVGDVRQIRIAGLAGTTYVDKVRQGQRFPEAGDVTISAETDRVYQDTTATCRLLDPLLARQVVITKDGSYSTVVWNPWIDKAKAMKDFGDDEWPGMVCIESANVMDKTITLAPGVSHHLTVSLGIQAL